MFAVELGEKAWEVRQLVENVLEGLDKEIARGMD